MYSIPRSIYQLWLGWKRIPNASNLPRLLALLLLACGKCFSMYARSVLTDIPDLGPALSSYHECVKFFSSPTGNEWLVHIRNYAMGAGKDGQMWSLRFNCPSAERPSPPHSPTFHLKTEQKKLNCPRNKRCSESPGQRAVAKITRSGPYELTSVARAAVAQRKPPLHTVIRHEQCQSIGRKGSEKSLDINRVVYFVWRKQKML
ncbi:hypothetical protein DFH07DRAFT_821425 [Mycena maculata]|uniref:Uncharacterized protein n=1 Tax=Mycena maculata TaxID=230809 RepID=A0AAD7NDX0_9AGAR|nr:hypothetical protein DFH07DRAFT_821425 [Mycena maculata]